MRHPSPIDPPLARTAARLHAIRVLSPVRVELLLRARSASKRVGAELVKIHRNQIHAKRVTETFVSNAVGLWMGMISAKFVSQFFDVRSLHNLWGLFSRQTIVSEGTYRVLCFGTEFLVALIVFSLTDHFIEEWRARREERASHGFDATSKG
jgi:hypothetical protein